MKKIILIVVLLSSLKISAQEWEILNTEMPLPVYGGEAVVVDSLIYILGGFSDSLNININVIQEYNPQNNSWRIIDSMNASRYGFVADNYNDSIVITGGIDLNLNLDSSLEIWNLLMPPFIFDLQLDFIRTYATGLVHNDNLYVFGGVLINPLSTYMFEYNIPDSTINFRENFGFLAIFPFQQMSALSGDSIFLFGGVFIGTSRAVYKYDIQNRTLDLLDVELTQSRSGGRAVALNDSLIYIIGGFNETSMALSSVELFHLNNGNYSVTNGLSLNFERTELMAVLYDNSIYVFGGKDDLGRPVKEVERYSPVTNVKEEPDELIKEYRLLPNYPNPFNPATNINFQIPERSFVKLKIYNINGEEIEELISEEMDEGSYTILFNVLSGKYGAISSGVYFYKLIAFNYSSQKTYIETRKMLLLK